MMTDCLVTYQREGGEEEEEKGFTRGHNALRERQGQRESELAGLSEHLVSVPAVTLSAKQAWVGVEFIGFLLFAHRCA